MTYSTFLILPQPSTVSIEGSSSLHPLHARASGPIGSVEAQVNASGIRLRNGSISLEVATLQSGNPLVDRETRRRINGRAALDVREWGLSLPRLGPLKVHPQIVVTIEISAQRQP